jgi:hypothetical protein
MPTGWETSRPIAAIKGGAAAALAMGLQLGRAGIPFVLVGSDSGPPNQ